MTTKYNNEKSLEITDDDRIDFDEKMTIEYKSNLYTILRFKYRDIDFFYAPIVLAERINKEQDFESEILDEVTYFITPEQMDEMYEILRVTPSWKKFTDFCASNGINCDFIWYYPFDDSEEFEDREYPTVEFFCNGRKCIYTTEKAYANDNFVEYLSDRDSAVITAATKSDLRKIANFLCDGKLYQEFEQFCKENNIYNLISKEKLYDKGFEFDTYEYRKAQERKKLPEGYSEEDEETVEISEEEYTRLSQTLDRFLSKKNPRWCKDGVVEEKFAEFCKSVVLPGICGHIRTNIKRYEDEIKNYEYCKNNNALIYEQYRNVSKFQNVLQDAINCSNNVYTDFLNIKDLATALMDEFSVNNFQKKYDKFFAKGYLTEETQVEDYELRNRYKIENTGKTVFERVSFSSLENVFDAVYVTDIKPPFKVIDLETSEDVSEKVLEIAESQNYIFIDTEEIIKKLPDLSEDFKEGAYGCEYLDKKDNKQIKCLNYVNFKHIIGFKDLWQKNCVPFGFKRNFILFADLNQPNTPIYRIDYRKTSDFESRKLLCASFEDYFSYIPSDWSN